MKVVVIGGVAAGMSAASKIRRSAPEAEVIVYEKGKDLSYGACGMPYYIGDEIKELKKLVIRTKDKFEESGIIVRDLHEVLEVSPKEKTLTIKNLTTDEIFTDTYDKLVVATGASPVRPSWPGTELEEVYVLSTLVDGQRLKEKVMNKAVNNVVIVGAGFIGIELAETIRGLGKNVTVIEFQNQILTHIDEELASQLEEEMKRNGVAVKTSEGVEAILGQDHVTGVRTSKTDYPADMVVLAIGVRPNTNMFPEGSIDKLGNGAIVVNKKMESSVPDIYAAGDCASVYHLIKDDYRQYIPLATNANKQGKLIGSIISGEEGEFLGALGSSMIKVFDMEAGKSGLSEKEAIAMGIDYMTKTVKSYNHAHYYPGAKPMTVKIVVDKSSHVLVGAQIIGYEGAALRANIAAVAIHAGMTTENLGMMDFGYAPPFSPTWDGLQIACNLVK